MYMFTLSSVAANCGRETKALTAPRRDSQPTPGQGLRVDRSCYSLCVFLSFLFDIEPYAACGQFMTNTFCNYVYKPQRYRERETFSNTKQL